MDKIVAVCLSLAIWLSLLQYGMNTARLGESKVSYGVLDDAVRPHLIARMPLTGTSVKEWVAMTTPAHSKYVYIHRRWTYRKSRQRFPPSWLQTMLLRILLTVLRLRDRLMVLCIRVLLAVLRAWIFLVLLRIRTHSKAMRVYHVLHQCLQSVVHYPLVLVTMVTGYAASVVEMLLMRSGDVEPNPGPTGQLCSKDLVTVLTELLDVCANWYNFGLALNLNPDILNALKGPHKELQDCLRDMLAEWLRRSRNPSWENLVKALRHDIVRREDLARKLEHEYCTHKSEPVDQDQAQAQQTEVQTMSYPQPTVEPPPEPSQRGIKGKIKDLEDSFKALAFRCFTALEDQNETGRRLAACLMSLSVTIRDHHEEFLKQDLAQVKTSPELMDVWEELITYCDFLNYELLQHVINTFGDDSLRTDMEEYVREIKSFHRTTPLCKFVENWPKRDIKPPEDKFRKLVAKMDLEWDKCTLEDIELFRDAFTQKFFPKKSTLLLKEIETGCVLITWYIPVDTAITLKRDLQNTRDRELFKNHRVEWLTVDGDKCFYSPLRQYANFLKDVYTSENPPSGLTSAPTSDTPLHFSLAKIEKEQISEEKSDPFTQSTLRGDKDDIPRKKTKISFTDVGRLPDDSSSRLVLIEGAPGVGKTTFSWEYCRRWARGELLQMMSLVLLLPLRDNRIRAAKSLSDLFYHSDPELRREIVQELERSQGEGVVIWLEALDEFGQSLGEQPNSIFLDLILGKILPKATIFITSRPHGSRFLLEQHEQRIAQHVEILGSAREQIEAVAKTPSSIGRRFLTYISENPMIKAVMYTPVTSAMVLEVFNYSLAKNTNLPATMTELYTAFTCKRLSDYLSHHPEYGTQQWTVHKFSDLPHKVHVQFRELCALAYRGIENNQQIVFSNLPPGFDSLGLMQEVPQLYIKETAPSSYNFIHLTVQEYLAAVHLSGQTPDVQTELILKQRQYRRDILGELTFADFGHYNMIFRFLSGLTKMVHIPPSITDQMLESRGRLELGQSWGTLRQMLESRGRPWGMLGQSWGRLEQSWGTLGQLSLSHWLCEAQDSERTALTLGKREKVVNSDYSWTPLDYYVTGYCISHSHCPWRLEFSWSSFDDEAMEMLSRGSSTAPDPTYTGYISHADFTNCTVTSKVIEHFTQLPQHILQSMRELRLQRNKLDGKACNLLATIIPTMNSLEKLNLSHNPILSGGAVELIKALCGHTRLRELDLGWTNIGEEDCECLSELLASSQSITRLIVCYNDLSQVSVGHIISGLSHNSSLTYLHMLGSEFSEDNTVHLSTVLRDTQRCKLERLLLDYCSITASGACHLAESLHTNSTLKVLWLNNNPIGVDGASAFAAMLPVNTSLERLYLRDDSIGEEGVQQLIKGLNTNETLKQLSLPKKYRQSSTKRIQWF